MVIVYDSVAETAYFFEFPVPKNKAIAPNFDDFFNLLCDDGFYPIIYGNNVVAGSLVHTLLSDLAVYLFVPQFHDLVERLTVDDLK